MTFISKDLVDATQWLSGLELSLFALRFSWRSATTWPHRVVAFVQDADAVRGNHAVMTTLTPIAVGRAARSPLTGVRQAFTFITAWLRTRWQRAQWDEGTRFLSDAADHADRERRMRALERCGVRPPW